MFVFYTFGKWSELHESVICIALETGHIVIF